MIRYLGRILLLACLPLSLFAVRAEAAIEIDTQPLWNGIDIMARPFGEPNSATYGQTFTVDSIYTTLETFTFWLRDDDSSPYQDVRFAGYISAWDGSKAVGAPIYTSPMVSTTSAPGMEMFTFDTGGIDLVGGGQYVAYLSASNFFDGVLDRRAEMGGALLDTYAGGTFVFQNNGDNFGQLTASDWVVDAHNDAKFVATFSTVPEPAAVVVWSVLGLLAVSATALRRRKSLTSG